jgi:sulfopyruvate decarboxylase subunit beta
MKRGDVIREFVATRGDSPVIVGPGASSGTLYHTRHHDATIYNMEMGYATAVCLGLALATPDQQVVSIEGDGSMVMGMGVFTTIARFAPRNLVVLIIDNGVYGTTGYGDVETVSGTGVSLAEIARASGIGKDQVRDVSDVESLRNALDAAATAPGPWIIRASIEREQKTPGPKLKPEHDLVETALSMRRAMMARARG